MLNEKKTRKQKYRNEVIKNKERNIQRENKSTYEQLFTKINNILYKLNKLKQHRKIRFLCKKY